MKLFHTAVNTCIVVVIIKIIDLFFNKNTYKLHINHNMFVS